MTNMRKAAQAATEAMEAAARLLETAGFAMTGTISAPYVAAMDGLRAALREPEPVASTHPDPAQIAALSFAWRSGYKQGVEDAAHVAPAPDCWCHKCSGNKIPIRMIVCPKCGNKRCPHASDHNLPCTGSNDPGQPGSVYTAAPAPAQISDGRIYEIMFEILPPVLRDTPSRQALHLEFARAVLAAAKEK